MTDQAAALRHLMANRREPLPVGGSTCEIITVTSGKGGVGKSNITMNLALALASEGRKVLILDADIGTANIDILMGLHPRRHLGHVFEGESTLVQILCKMNDNLYLIPGASGITGINEMPLEHLEQFRKDILQLETMFDYLLVDTAAGVSPQVTNLLKGSDRTLLVCNHEPTSILDAYALCKVLFASDELVRMEFLANNVSSELEAEEVYGKLSVAVKHFLKKDLQYLSYVVHDKGVADGVINQKPLMLSEGASPAKDNFRTLAVKLAHGESWASGKGVQQLFNLLTEA